jgi:Cu/Ag efflux pump CusA
MAGLSLENLRAIIHVPQYLLTAIKSADKPVFNCLAVVLLFGILVSTVLTLLVSPVMYYAFTKGTLRSR